MQGGKHKHMRIMGSLQCRKDLTGREQKTGLRVSPKPLGKQQIHLLRESILSDIIRIAGISLPIPAQANIDPIRFCKNMSHLINPIRQLMQIRSLRHTMNKICGYKCLLFSIPLHLIVHIVLQPEAFVIFRMLHACAATAFTDPYALGWTNACAVQPGHHGMQSTNRFCAILPITALDGGQRRIAHRRIHASVIPGHNQILRHSYSMGCQRSYQCRCHNIAGTHNSIRTGQRSGCNLYSDLFRNIFPEVSVENIRFLGINPRLLTGIQKSAKPFHRGNMVGQSSDTVQLPAAVALNQMLCHLVHAGMLLRLKSRESRFLPAQNKAGHICLPQAIKDLLNHRIRVKPIRSKQNSV